MIITTWPPLNQWIVKDNEFLIWRQDLSGKLESWKNAGEPNDLLLNTTSVAEAKRWKEHEKDLFENEIDYIKRSITHREKRRQKRLRFLS